ncbi:hypothetical protein J4E85_001379, partial [Alternaria conjuncta]|uniref:uncharacterized protein n=1 Tax=Alternaria conjuncta TaxID=181017 RepID=UPI0022206F66
AMFVDFGRHAVTPRSRLVVSVLSSELSAPTESQQSATAQNQSAPRQRPGQALKDDWHRLKPS